MGEDGGLALGGGGNGGRTGGQTNETFSVVPRWPHFLCVRAAAKCATTPKAVTKVHAEAPLPPLRTVNMGRLISFVPPRPVSTLPRKISVTGAIRASSSRDGGGTWRLPEVWQSTAW